MVHWLNPPLVSGPCPQDRNKEDIYVVSDHFLDCNAAVFRHTPIFQMWAHVVGQLPPINNISRVDRGDTVPELTTLADSVALFQGVKRPYDDEENGESILVYVLNPKVSLDYVPDLVCMAKAVVVPRNTCLTVQVKPYKEPLQLHGQLVKGVVTRSEFVLGAGNPTLPRRHEKRYVQLLWQT